MEPSKPSRLTSSREGAKLTNSSTEQAPSSSSSSEINRAWLWDAVRWITFAIVLMILFIFIAGFIYKWGT